MSATPNPHGSGEAARALLALRTGLARDPGNRALRRELAKVYLGMGRFEEAMAQIRPPGPEPLTDLDRQLLAWTLVGEGRLEEAWPLLQGLSNEAACCRDLGLIVADRHHWDRAVPLFARARDLEPGDPDAWFRLSLALAYCDRFQEAEGVAGEAIGRYPHRDEAWARLCFHLGVLHLLQGRWETGLQLLEARYALHGTAADRDLPPAAWKAEALAGRTLVLRREQGIGDVFMAIRFAPMLKAMGARVLVESVPGPAGLLATCPGVDAVIPWGAPLPPGAMRVPVMSLPLGLGARPDQLPAQVPYLSVPETVPNRAAIDAALAGLPGRTLGLVWAGAATHVRDAERSLPPALLDGLRRLEGFSWVSLQKEAGPRPALPLTELGPLLADYSATAYALSRLDGLIAVDTSVVHLAGALGRPVWTLLTHLPDWRWLLARADTPWYPTMELWRQPAPGDWTSVLEGVVARLQTRGFPRAVPPHS